MRESLTQGQIIGLRERIRALSVRVAELRPVLGDDLTNELAACLDAGVVLGNQAVPFEHMPTGRSPPKGMTQAEVDRLREIEARYYELRNCAEEFVKAYKVEDDDDC